MLTLTDFKQRILDPLLRGDSPTGDAPITLFAARLDDPLSYLFESNRWAEVSGAARRLARAGEKLSAILAADGYTADMLLHNSPLRVLALCHDAALAQRWAAAIERAVAAETDIVTVSTVLLPVTIQQLIGGLYRSPRSVIGVPGMNDYQERINRYYGLNSPSTVPKDETIAQRRHFGEVVALLHTLLTRVSESRQIVPFYESLPYAERCDSCRVRPAETLQDGSPVCGVCLRKRTEISRDSSLSSAAGRSKHKAIIRIEAIGLNHLLEQQRTLSAYRRLCQEMIDVLRSATNKHLSTTRLVMDTGWLMLTVPAANAVDIAVTILESIAMHYGLKTPTAFAASVTLGTNELPALNDLAEQTLTYLRRIEGNASMIDVRVYQPSQPFDRFRKPYTLDEARRLSEGVTLLQSAKLPMGLFAELSEQATHGNAGLYYTFERSKLSQADQQTFQRLERAWEVGAVPGPRFFAMLTVALALATQEP